MFYAHAMLFYIISMYHDARDWHEPLTSRWAQIPCLAYLKTMEVGYSNLVIWTVQSKKEL